MKRGRAGHHERGHHRAGRSWLEDDELLWRGRGGRGGRGRAFEYGKLRYAVLQMIADKPSHGYELIKAIEERTEGAYTPSPGVVYPTLTLLEDLGYIAADSSDDNRKLFKATAAGRKYLTENRQVVEEVNARLSASADSRGTAEPPQIVRALHNLKTALRLRIGTETALNASQVQAIAATLDAAAAGIERI